MPPPARYLGLQTWIWTTGWVSDESPWDTEAYNYFSGIAGDLIQYLFATFPVSDTVPDPSEKDQYRVQSFSSIDDNINNVVMENRCDPACPPWDEIKYFVITPDQNTNQAVRDVLESLGVDQDDVFTEGIPQAFQGEVFFDDNLDPVYIDQDPIVGPIGLDQEAVDFLTLIRYSMPDDEQAATVWRKSLPKSLSVLRVRRLSAPDADPYDPYDPNDPNLPGRIADERDGQNESGLGDDLTALVDAVVARADSQGLALATDPEYGENPQPMIDLLNALQQFGPACRYIGMNCLGDNQDASYFLFKPRPLDTGRIYAVVSTLATETGNGTYVGLSVNDASLLKGVLNISDTQLEESKSADYYSSEVTDPNKFFVHFFTRDCDAIADLTDGACTTITERMVPLAGDDKAPGDPELHGKFSAAVRAYVAVGSERGANPPLQLPPVLITFQWQ